VSDVESAQSEGDLGMPDLEDPELNACNSQQPSPISNTDLPDSTKDALVIEVRLPSPGREMQAEDRMTLSRRMAKFP